MIERQSLICLMALLLLFPITGQVQDSEEVPAARAIPVEEAAETEPAIPRAVPVIEVPVEPAPEPGHDGEPLNPDLPVGLTILSPGPREVIEGNTLDLFISLKNYALGNPERGGNRIHVIMDNQPPRIVYDIDRPVTFANLAAGGHTVRVFACRPDGTALRDESAFAICHFFIGKKDFQNYIDPRNPYLTVNLPMAGTADSTDEGMVIFDYIVHHPEQINGFRVRYDLSGGYTGELMQQGPVYWNNFSPGKHRLLVEFLDEKGKLVAGPFNQIEREFVVQEVVKAEPVTADDLPVELNGEPENEAPEVPQEFPVQ